MHPRIGWSVGCAIGSLVDAPVLFQYEYVATGGDLKRICLGCCDVVDVISKLHKNYLRSKNLLLDHVKALHETLADKEAAGDSDGGDVEREESADEDNASSADFSMNVETEMGIWDIKLS